MSMDSQEGLFSSSIPYKSLAIESPATRPGTGLHSCLLCRQRKIKCDKQDPCFNCVRAQKECIYSTPAPPRRRKGRVRLSEEQLLRRLRQYETILKSKGMKVEDLERLDDSGPVLNSSSDASNELAVQKGSLITEVKQLSVQSGASKGSPVQNLWTNLSNELLEGLSEEEQSTYSITDEVESLSDPDPDIFVFDPRPLDTLLTLFHPPPAQIFKLWQIFLDYVNPVTKVIHTPTVQRLLLEASVDLEHVSRPMEALLFVIYSGAITSMSDEECNFLMGESKAKLRARYHKVTQQALMRAGLFGTLNMVVLQAAALFLKIFRRDYDSGEFWIITGIVVRIAQRLGLHRESDSTKFSVLDTEIRRRLWWQISVLDARGTERSGVGVSATANLFETSRPLNVNDSDLTPGMTIPPRDHVGATEMLYPLMMYEVGTFLRHSKSMAAFDGSLQKLSHHTVPLTEKNNVINELEALLEDKFLRHCDPVIPLHILATHGVRIVLGRMRMASRHPQRYPDRGINMPQEERKFLFDICLMMVEQDNFIFSTPSLRGFLWHVDLQSQLDAIVYLLSELRRRVTQHAADKAWMEITEAFEHHPHIITDTKNPLFAAVRSLALKSWEAREAEYANQYLIPPEGSPPLFIAQIRVQRTHSTRGHTPIEPQSGLTQPLNGQPNPQMLTEGSNGTFEYPLDLDPMSTDLAEMDWTYWNDLMHTM